MRKILFSTVMQLTVVAVLLTGCSKQDDIVIPTPAPPVQGYFTVKLKAAITVGDVLYDSIPAIFTITSWDVNSVAKRKDTSLSAGAQVIYLPKDAVRYSIKMQKWGVTYEKTLNRAEVAEGAIYLLGGQKEAKKLQLVTEETFVNGAPILSSKQEFVYDVQGRVNEVHSYAPDLNGVLRAGNIDLFLYGGNELWVNTMSASTAILFSHSAYTFDAQGRTVESKYEYLTEKHVYTNLYTSEGILMLFGKNAVDVNGSRIALKFSGGNLVEEKTMITNYATVVKQFRHDFNINPYVIIKMPSLYFEHSSKNNVVAQAWGGNDQYTYTYEYDAEGYVNKVTTRIRNNDGQFVNYSRTVYTY